MIAKVAVENTAFSFDDAFDYAIPEKLSKDVRPGVRVLVPFGRGSKKRQGVVFALREKSKDTVKLKNIAAVLDPSPLLNNEMLRLYEGRVFLHAVRGGKGYAAYRPRA